MLFLQQNSHWLNRFQNATSEKKVPHIVQDGQENTLYIKTPLKMTCGCAIQ